MRRIWERKPQFQSVILTSATCARKDLSDDCSGTAVERPVRGLCVHVLTCSLKAFRCRKVPHAGPAVVHVDNTR